MENQQLTAQTAKELCTGIAVKTGTVGANWHQIDAKISNYIGLDGRADTWRVSPRRFHLLFRLWPTDARVSAVSPVGRTWHQRLPKKLMS